MAVGVVVAAAIRKKSEDWAFSDKARAFSEEEGQNLEKKERKKGETSASAC